MYRTRQNASACAPMTWCSPLDSCSFEFGSLMDQGRQMLTPPMSLMIFSKPVKFSSMKWSRWMPVSCSTVFHRQPGPPEANDELICSTWPGWACWPVNPVSGPHSRTGTTESRGMLRTVAPCLPGEMCRIMIVSERWPWTPAPNFALFPDRLSEPISTMFSELVL
jgi:hypothetical protein